MHSLLTGPPGDINDVNIPPDAITACSFVVQWSRPSIDPVCGSIWYIVTVTEGGMLIINDTTTLTDYNVTGLTNNTSYHVTVTASNNAGSSSGAASISIRTNSNGKSMHMYACIYNYVNKIPFFTIIVCICEKSLYNSTMHMVSVCYILYSMY